MRQKIIIAVPTFFVIASIASVFAQSNPPIANQVEWDSPQTKELFYQTCADCHSHETKWPWYASIAPISFPVLYHVAEGREHFNISVPDMGEYYEAAEELEEGEMPESSYLWLHPEAKLSIKEKEALLQGLKKTFGEEEH